MIEPRTTKDTSGYKLAASLSSWLRGGTCGSVSRVKARVDIKIALTPNSCTILEMFEWVFMEKWLPIGPDIIFSTISDSRKRRRIKNTPKCPTNAASFQFSISGTHLYTSNKKGIRRNERISKDSTTSRQGSILSCIYAGLICQIDRVRDLLNESICLLPVCYNSEKVTKLQYI